MVSTVFVYDGLSDRLKDLISLTKPRITAMAVVVAFGSALLAQKPFQAASLGVSLFGIALLVASSSVLNMYLERFFDGLMLRTKDRPLPAGRLSSELAFLFGLFLFALALPCLAATNGLTFWLGVCAWVLYVGVYTPLKRISHWSFVVGAIPGAMPSVLGYAATEAHLDGIMLSLFLVAFFWQLPHVLCIAVFRQDEYTHAGYPTVSALFGLKRTKQMICATTLGLFASSLLLFLFGIGGLFYLLAALILGFIFIYFALLGWTVCDDMAWSRQVFLYSLVYQTGLFVALALDVGLLQNAMAGL